MPWVSQNFAAIDSQHKGYITVQDVRAYAKRCVRLGPALPRRNMLNSRPIGSSIDSMLRIPPVMGG